MNPMQPGVDYGEGRLPGKAPLANPYVPFQYECPVKYDPMKGLMRGTLYPGLELPFKGIVNKREMVPSGKALVQALCFAVQELALYLDTHRHDQEALELYKQYQEKLKKAKANYIESCGPVDHDEVGRTSNFDWLNDPWPWEYAANREV